MLVTSPLRYGEGEFALLNIYIPLAVESRTG
jgi:hypothetical protein